MVQNISKKVFVSLIAFTVIYCRDYGFAQQSTNREEIVLTTYYPVPYGDYRNLRLWPSNTEATKNCDDNTRGTLFYDENTNEVKVCRKTETKGYAWQVLGLWSKKDDALYPNDATWKVGIGTDAPQGKLEVNGGNLVVQNGGVGIGTTTLGTYGDQQKQSQMQVDSTGYIGARDVWLKDTNQWASKAGGGGLAAVGSCPAGYTRINLVGGIPRQGISSAFIGFCVKNDFYDCPYSFLLE